MSTNYKLLSEYHPLNRLRRWEINKVNRLFDLPKTRGFGTGRSRPSTPTKHFLCDESTVGVKEKAEGNRKVTRW